MPQAIAGPCRLKRFYVADSYILIDGIRYRIVEEKMVHAARFSLGRSKIIDKSYSYNTGWLVRDEAKPRKTNKKKALR